jgi:hypothetical protein
MQGMLKLNFFPLLSMKLTKLRWVVLLEIIGHQNFSKLCFIYREIDRLRRKESYFSIAKYRCRSCLMPLSFVHPALSTPACRCSTASTTTGPTGGQLVLQDMCRSLETESG